MGHVSVAEVRDTERRTGELNSAGGVRRMPQAPGEKAKVLTVSPDTMVTVQRHITVILSRLFFAWDHPLPMLNLSSLWPCPLNATPSL